ncbi:exo-alpha-sialidase [Desulfonatronum parangueonense]
MFLALGLVVAFHHQGQMQPLSSSFLAPKEPAVDPEEPFYRTHFVTDGDTRLVHAATSVHRRDGMLQAFWFGGTREGHKDVKIYTAEFDPDEQHWHDETVLVTRACTQAGEGRYIRKLGNPVAGIDPDGRIWLFYVSVSFGGWSGSSINLIMSEDNGRTWTEPRQLITSPFLNISTLVKGPPVFFTDGTLGLPVYHEFLRKFSEFLRLDHQGRVVSKTRITWGRSAIQPVVFPKDEHNAVVLMRNVDSDWPRRAWISATTDAGRTWSQPERTEIANQDSALGGLAAGPRTLLSVANVSEHRRSALSLLRSRDQGRSWSFVHDVEPPQASLTPEHFPNEVVRILADQLPADLSPGTVAAAAADTQCEYGRPHCHFRFDYPWLMKDNIGRFHLFYTWNRSFIRHVTFNQAWLAEQSDQSLTKLAYQEYR